MLQTLNVHVWSKHAYNFLIMKSFAKEEHLKTNNNANFKIQVYRNMVAMPTE